MPRKRAPNGSGTIRKRADGRWEIFYCLGRDPGTGRLIRKNAIFHTETEAAKELRRVTSAIDDNVFVEPSRMPLSQWLDIWFEQYSLNVKEHTRTTYETQIRVHIKPALGAVALASLKPHEIQTFYTRLHNGKKDVPPLSPKTIKNIHGVLHRALSQAVVIGYLRQNPCLGVVLPRVERANIKPLMDEQVSVFLDAIRGNEYENLFFVTMYTGMRQSEVMGLTWDCVDFKGGTINIEKQLIREKKKGGVYKFAPLKNDKPRRIKPAQSVMHRLDAILKQQKIDKLRAGSAWENTMNLVFVNVLGGHYVHNTLAHNFKRIVTAMGIPDRRFHDLRHTYAVLALQAGIDIKTVQESLGHYTPAFTLEIYGHVSERMQEDAAARMEAAISAHERKVQP